MPAPFPGIDPFIEGQAWSDFHLTMISEVRAALIPLVRPRYIVRVEERVYLDEQAEDEIELIEPDVFVAEEREPTSDRGGAATGVAVAPEPVIVSLPMSAQRRQRFLALRDRESLRLVTVIEILSPTNERSGGDGRRQYLEKRKELLQSAVNLIELDLLRGGRRPPVVGRLPEGDYYATVARAPRRPRAEVYAWTIRQPLPSVPVPLSESDPDVVLDLQAIFTMAYDRAGYDYSLDYHRPVVPPLGEADAGWAQEILPSR
jgi:uncharacterized protein DUF4058